MSQDNYTKVATDVNKHLSRIRFALWLDFVNCHNINILAFHNNQDINLIINVYLDSNQTALQFLN